MSAGHVYRRSDNSTRRKRNENRTRKVDRSARRSKIELLFSIFQSDDRHGRVRKEYRFTATTAAAAFGEVLFDAALAMRIILCFSRYLTRRSDESNIPSKNARETEKYNDGCGKRETLVLPRSIGTNRDNYRTEQQQQHADPYRGRVRESIVTVRKY